MDSPPPYIAVFNKFGICRRVLLLSAPLPFLCYLLCTLNMWSADPTR